jgi:hypothetical protein
LLSADIATEEPWEYSSLVSSISEVADNIACRISQTDFEDRLWQIYGTHKVKQLDNAGPSTERKTVLLRNLPVACGTLESQDEDDGADGEKLVRLVKPQSSVAGV